MRKENVNKGTQLSRGVKRRQFIKGTSAAALTAGVWSEVAAQESTSANEKLKILCVVTANRASANIDAIKSQDVVGICDVDSNYLDRAASQFGDARKYADYREMISAEADRADAIVIAVADHNHAPASIRAINAGLHCYCEKPLTHTVHEARLIAQAAKAKGVATQMGTQIHAGANYRRVVEVIQSGAIGDVKEVHVWVGKGWGGGDVQSVEKLRRQTSTGTYGLDRLRNAPTRRVAITRHSGGGGGISDKEHLATWDVTTWTFHSGLSSLGIPLPVKHFPMIRRCTQKPALSA